MQVERHVVDIETATGGGATGYTPPLTGRIASIAYSKDGSNAFASTADFTISLETDGDTLWAESNVNASKRVDPVRQAATSSGAAVTGIFGGIHAARDRVKVVIAQGGNTKNGSFAVTVI